jgi:hypothetical protein
VRLLEKLGFSLVRSFTKPAAAEMMRRRLGLADIYVAIVPGRNDGLRWEDADYEAVISRANRQSRVQTS